MLYRNKSKKQVVLMMKEQEAISYLESLERGQYVTVNIPISKNDNLPITALK